MIDKEAHRNSALAQPVVRTQKRTTLPASDVGVTLKISEQTLAKLDRIRDEAIKAAQESRNLLWR